MQAKNTASRPIRGALETCRVCALDPWCLTWSLGPEDARRLERIVSHPEPLKAGDELFRAGDGLQASYAVRSGAFKNARMDGPGDEDVLGFTLPGELLGLDGIQSRQYRSSAVALEASTVCVLPYSELTSLVGAIGSLREQMLRRASGDFGARPDRNSAPEQRLAAFLMNLSDRLQANGRPARELALSMSRRDMGAYLGIPVEAVSRLFSDLVARKLVAVDGHSLRLLDPAALALLARNGR